MTKAEIDLIRRAIELLHHLVPDAEPHTGVPRNRECPVLQFARKYLLREPDADVSSHELWKFYSEIVAAGELEPLTQRAFQRTLPGAMELTFGVKKCHSIKRAERTVRGFKGVDLRLDV